MSLIRIICTLPNASTEINGIKFTPFSHGVISDEMARETAEQFLAIDGYHIDGEEAETDLDETPEPAAPVAEKKVAAPAPAARARNAAASKPAPVAKEAKAAKEPVAAAAAPAEPSAAPAAPSANAADAPTADAAAGAGSSAPDAAASVPAGGAQDGGEITDPNEVF